MQISIPDNTKKEFSEFSQATVSDLKNLSSVANKKISELAREKNILIFPCGLNSAKDKIGDEKIFTLENSNNFSSAKISTGNLMGFVGIKNTQLKIYSRFDSSKKDYFLHYMLQKIFHFNLFDFKTHSADEKIFDFLLFLFPHFLNSAMTQGIFREYKIFERNDANVKGALQISRHIAQNIPFAGKIAYRSREYSFDNDVNELIRHTIEFIKENSLGSILREGTTRENVRRIVEVTKNYKRQERQKIAAKNLKPLCTAFFSKYIPLQKLCRMILQHKKLCFGQNGKQVYGILFDGAWLWEEFLWEVFRTKIPELVHGENKIGKNSFNPFESKSSSDGTTLGKFIPDFYVKDKIVLDAKYKKFDERNPDAADLSQIISYMHVLNAPEGIFVYPKRVYANNSVQIEVEESTLGTLRGMGGTMKTLGVPILQDAKDFSRFAAEMEKCETDLQDKVCKLCSS
ncbi:MAG: McrC family protein [Bacteroides sp.]|nr:McrC family protein [Prevotella sp.]MCM1408125.1 McrC family protein [Treponema brennaborense]MCM1469449.1 McrC family protein [Bacteroides sp.]